MKKFSKLILVILCLFMITGCKIYVYNFDSSNSQSGSGNGSSDLGGNQNSGTTIVTPETNYTGFVNYTNSIPTVETPWNVIYENVKTSVVTIRNIVSGEITSTGSGVFFAEDSTANGYAYIFTNAHVVKGSTSIEVLLSNDILVDGTLIGYDENEDVAVVKVSKRNDYSIATLRHSNTLRVGEAIMAVGSPLGEEFSTTATHGIISNLNIAMTPDTSSLDLYLIQIDAPLNPGNSGGPLFDNAGNLIGINTMKLVNSGTNSNIESFNYSIPISHFELVSSYLLNGSLYYRPFLNITIVDIRLLGKSERQEYNLSVDNGLLVLEMGDTSPLKGKVAINEVITYIEGVKVNKSTDFSVELLKHAPNDTIEITVCGADGTNTRNVNITLIKR